jgi:hypothetical protein
VVTASAGSARPIGALAENAAALGKIAAKGVDVSRSCTVDFEHIFRDIDGARAFADEAAREGYAIEIAPYFKDDFMWNVKASREIIPTAEMITDAAIGLGYFATLYGGRADGWGFYGAR